MAASTARAQVTVRAGHSWSYEFASIPFLDWVPPSSPIWGVGRVSLRFTGSPSQRYSYTIELFQDTFTQPAEGYLQDYSQDGVGIAGGYGLWKDLQGGVRCNVLTGELTLTEVQIDTWYPDSLSVPLAHHHIVARISPIVLRSAIATNASGMKEVTLAWTTNASRYVLQSVPSLGSGQWVEVTNTLATIHGEYHVALPAGQTGQFFRLENR
jgi:hypothetical protein